MTTTGTDAALTQERLLAMLAEHEELQAREDIRDCLLRYTRGVDRHDTELAMSAYHEDARDDHVLYVGPGHGLVRWAEGLHDEQYASHHHYVLNSTIDRDDDTAHVETYFLFTGILVGTHETVVGGGRYLDRFERRDGRWAIADRICVPEWGWDAATLEQLEPLTVAVSQDRDDPSYLRPLRVTRENRILAGPGARPAA